MGSLSVVHWLLVALVVLLLFGPARLKAVGRDLGAGLRSFKQGVNEEYVPESASKQTASPLVPRSDGGPAGKSSEVASS